MWSKNGSVVDTATLGSAAPSGELDGHLVSVVVRRTVVIGAAPLSGPRG